MTAETERQVIEVDGARVAYRRAGSGPPLVLLHGIGGNADQWSDQLSGLAGQYDVVAWDAPGYLGSDDPPREWALGDYADRLAGFLDRLGFERVHLAGQSWGGGIAQAFALRHPERLRSLTLANTAEFGARPAAERQTILEGRLRALKEMTPAELAAARAPALVPPGTPEPIRQTVTEVMAAIRPSGYRLAAISLSHASQIGQLAELSVPTLVIAGELDRVVPPAQAEALAEAIPGAELVVIPGSGHMTNQEQPERFNALLRAFLEHVDGAAAPDSGRDAGA